MSYILLKCLTFYVFTHAITVVWCEKYSDNATASGWIPIVNNVSVYASPAVLLPRETANATDVNDDSRTRTLRNTQDRRPSDDDDEIRKRALNYNEFADRDDFKSVSISTFVEPPPASHYVQQHVFGQQRPSGGNTISTSYGVPEPSQQYGLPYPSYTHGSTSGSGGQSVDYHYPSGQYLPPASISVTGQYLPPSSVSVTGQYIPPSPVSVSAQHVESIETFQTTTITTNADNSSLELNAKNTLYIQTGKCSNSVEVGRVREVEIRTTVKYGTETQKGVCVLMLYSANELNKLAVSLQPAKGTMNTLPSGTWLETNVKMFAIQMGEMQPIVLKQNFGPNSPALILTKSNIVIISFVVDRPLDFFLGISTYQSSNC